MPCEQCAQLRTEGGYRRCERHRAYFRLKMRQRRAAQPSLLPRPMRERALTLLSTFILTPAELSCALDITLAHASMLLRRLWKTQQCERWPHGAGTYRYALRGLL